MGRVARSIHTRVVILFLARDGGWRDPRGQGAETASDAAVKEYTEPGATLADFLASPRGRMALLGAARPVDTTDAPAGGGKESFTCVVEQVRVLNFCVNLILTGTIAPYKGKGGMGAGGHAAAAAAAGVTVTISEAEVRGLPGYGVVSRALDVGCVNDLTWRPQANGTTVVSSAARITARGDASSAIGRGIAGALTAPVVGGVMRVGVDKALELAVRTSVEGSVKR